MGDVRTSTQSILIWRVETRTTQLTHSPTLLDPIDWNWFRLLSEYLYSTCFVHSENLMNIYSLLQSSRWSLTLYLVLYRRSAWQLSGGTWQIHLFKGTRLCVDQGPFISTATFLYYARFLYAYGNVISIRLLYDQSRLHWILCCLLKGWVSHFRSCSILHCPYRRCSTIIEWWKIKWLRVYTIDLE